MRVWKDINIERPPLGILVLTFSGGENFGQYVLDELSERQTKSTVPIFSKLGHGVVSHWCPLPKAPLKGGERDG